MNELSAISHPWNPIVPIESIFEDPESPWHIFVITELLHGAEHPLWRYTEELLEFGEQVLSVRSHLVFEMLPDESDVLHCADHRISTLSEHFECVSIAFGLLCSLLIRNIWYSIPQFNMGCAEDENEQYVSERVSSDQADPSSRQLRCRTMSPLPRMRRAILHQPSTIC